MPHGVVDATQALMLGLLWFGVIYLARRSFWYPIWFDGYISAGLWLVGTVALRRIAPTWMFWITVVAYPLTQQLGLDSYFQLLPLMVAGFAMARTGRLPVTVVAVISGASTAALVTAVVASITHDLPLFFMEVSPSSYLVSEALVVGAVVMGATFRRLEMTGDSLRERNEELRDLQEALAHKAVIDERARIARELHDVVAHHVSAIVVRAQAADHVADRQPSAPRDAVRWIAAEGKLALTAMRSIVHVLRTDAGPEWAPTPTSATVLLAVQEAADRVRAAGRNVDLVLPDEIGPVSAETGLALTRIAQEALTNVLLHSLCSHVSVTVTTSPDHVSLTVHDDGPATGASGGGNGLTHMRERAAACGGRVATGPDGSGWIVHAELPRRI